MDQLLTIFTPTYNRSKMLKNLYSSLCRQTNKSFKWLIIDDGSQDDTKGLVEGFKNDKLLEIEYYYQVNSGKYIAHNLGVKKCNTELFVCVDSDDILYDNAVERTIAFWKSHNSDERIAGIVSPKDMNGNSYFLNPPNKDTLMHLYDSGSLIGETMLVYRTSILKQFLFPEITGEKFMSENVIYYQIDMNYYLAVQNEYLYYAEYQNDGITRSIAKTHWNNPNSTLFMYKTIAHFHCNPITASKACGCYFAWKSIRKLNDNNEIRRHLPISVLLGGVCLFPHYYCLFMKQKKEYSIV